MMQKKLLDNQKINMSSRSSVRDHGVSVISNRKQINLVVTLVIELRFTRFSTWKQNKESAESSC